MVPVKDCSACIGWTETSLLYLRHTGQRNPAKPLAARTSKHIKRDSMSRQQETMLYDRNPSYRKIHTRLRARQGLPPQRAAGQISRKWVCVRA